MSLRKSYGVDPIPEETRHVAARLCPKGTLPMHLRDALGSVYTDQDFAHLFAKWGRPAYAPWRMALITVFQALEGLTDRQAATFVHTRIDWLYALSLPLQSDCAFDFSLLSDFRQRLLDHDAADVLLEPLLQICRDQGWLKGQGKQRTDSTMVLARVRSLSSLESVGESMRATLNAIAEQEPDWLLEHLDPQWFERYVHRFELSRFPKEASKRARLQHQVGEDVQQLEHLLQAADVPESLAKLPEMGILRQIFAQHYEVIEGKVCWREEPLVNNHDRVVSPYDPEARSSRKRETSWLGYKVHLTETCDQDPACPHLVVNVETTPATVQDAEQLELIQTHLRQRDLAPKEQYVDQGYTSGAQLVEQARLGTQIVGPVPGESSWQYRAHAGYAVSDFSLDWSTRRATCPQGHLSQAWSRRLDDRHQPVELIRFPRSACHACPAQLQCTKGTKQGRTLTINVQAAHEALVQRRSEQYSPAFLNQYHLRAGVEGTMAQGIQVMGMRKTPYMGVAKTHVHHLAIAAAINLVRIESYLCAQTQGKSVRPARPLSPFARLQERREAQCA